MREKTLEKEAQSYFRKRGVSTKRNRGLCNLFKEAHGRTKVVSSRSCAVCQMIKEAKQRQYFEEKGVPYAKDVAARAYVAAQVKRRKEQKDARAYSRYHLHTSAFGVRRRKDRLAKSGSTGIPADLTDLLS